MSRNSSPTALLSAANRFPPGHFWKDGRVFVFVLLGVYSGVRGPLGGPYGPVRWGPFGEMFPV